MWRSAFLFLLIFAVLADADAQSSPVWTGLSVLCMVLLFAGWLTRLTIPANPSSIALVLFFCVVIVSLPVALLWGTNPRDWLLKGAAPFLFLSAYLFTPVRSDKDARFIATAFLVGAFVWAGKIIVTILFSDQSLLGRWTTISNDLGYPWALAAIPILLMGQWPRWVKIVGLPLFTALIIGGAFRMELLLLAMFLAFYFARSFLLQHLRVIAVLTVFFVAALVSWISTEHGLDTIERFDSVQSGADAGRWAEMSFAYNAFLESPILGKGLAYPVPLRVTYAGRLETLKRLTGQLEGFSSVPYIHNSVMYLLMTLGPIGLLSYGLFILGSLKGRMRLPLFMAFASSLTSITITLFQFHLIIVALALAARYKWHLPHQATGDVSRQNAPVHS